MFYYSIFQKMQLLLPLVPLNTLRYSTTVYKQSMVHWHETMHRRPQFILISIVSIAVGQPKEICQQLAC